MEDIWCRTQTFLNCNPKQVTLNLTRSKYAFINTFIKPWLETKLFFLIIKIIIDLIRELDMVIETF